MSAPPATLPAALYQGSVNTWECDDGGHLNVRFHCERAFIGLAHMAHALSLPRAFMAAAGSTLMPLEAHVRFLKEARPGAPLSMHGGVVRLEEQTATLCLDMRHADGAPSSCFTMRVAHVDTRDFKPFPWSQRARAVAKQLACALPAHAKPRSIDLATAPSEASSARAAELGAARIGASLVMPDQCDAFGRWRQEAGEETNAVPAGAVVEARIVFRRWPRAGDLIEIWSGVTEIGDKTMRLVHWICDPTGGAAWATMEVVAITFDTVTRKAIQPSEAARERMRARIVALAV